MKTNIDLLTVKELADVLKVKPCWVYNGTYRRLFPVIKVGKYSRYILNDVLAALGNSIEAIGGGEDD